MHSFLFKSGVLCCAAFSTIQYSQAEVEEPVYELETYLVSAGPGYRSVDDFATPFSILDAETLAREGGGSLGAVLDWQPGVSASSFSAGASRPVLRGFDGPRVRILDSGIEGLDASDTSPDHGVAMEPLLADRVEIIRGPSTLLYGSSAIGGVVNVIGKEIPRERVVGEIEGGAEARYDSVSAGETFLGYATVGGENWAATVTGLKRDADDYEIPDEAADELSGTFVETEQFSIGSTWFFAEDNHLGFAYSEYDSLYGIPEEDEAVSIDLNRKRFDAELEVIDPIEWIEALRVRLGYTDYEHRELEGAEVGTIFEREGWELRAEAAHAPVLFFDEGLVGVQLNDADFSALGEEAFTPASTTRSQALFISEHIDQGRLHYEFGGRLERQSVSADVDQGDYSDVAVSLAASAIWQINEAHSLALSLQRSERHPNSTELYADGPHLATSQYEIGDAELGLETAYGVDLTYRTEQDRWSGSFSIFYTYFEDYIFAEDMGVITDGLDTYQFAAIDADFKGFEAEVEVVLYESSDATVTLGLMGDGVWAENRDSDEALPRIPPLRIGSRLSVVYQSWEFGAEWRHAFAQNETAPNETETDGYNELNLDVSKRFELGKGQALTLFARADNLLDETIRNSTSFLKDEAPLPGRNFSVGARFEF